MDVETASLRSRLRLSAKRAQKSCGPCRTRKVKCNRAAPCVRCIKSGYPDLCLYDERARRSTVSVSSTQQPNEPSASAQRQDSHRATHVVDTPDHSPNTTSHLEQGQYQDGPDKHPYLGANSLPQFLDNESAVVTSPQDVTRQRARDAMMPMLGVAPSVPGYPFYTPLETQEEHAIARLLRSLPPSRDIVR
jgi:hypothetical protein